MKDIRKRCMTELSKLTTQTTMETWHPEELNHIARKLLFMNDFIRYNVFPPGIERRFAQLEEKASTHERASFYKGLLLVSMLELTKILNQSIVTSEIMTLYEGWLDRVLHECGSDEEESYTKSNDKMLKDLAICTGNMYPAGAQIVEITGIGKRTFLQGSRLSQAKGLLYLTRTLKLQTDSFYQIHTDDRYLHEFSAEGFYRCYLRIADMLLLHPEIQGVWGASWFFDPQIQHISPHLGYLYLRPFENGAHFFYQGTTASDITNATSTSRSRRKKMEAGEYTPTGYAMIWHRRELLQWAEDQRRKNTAVSQAV
ncbi:MAG: hypothetical protein CL920_23260 [Deltaproteobacteria bacterium]|nr:hypothetical protein [Deltaproteobacteria bacterium]MBU51619.1 hypothetical protein [Deltaproteobacteria bacterium]